MVYLISKFFVCQKTEKALKTKKPFKLQNLKGFSGIVGMAGFEPAASTSQMWRDTGLRYIPYFVIGIAKVGFLFAFANF